MSMTEPGERRPASAPMPPRRTAGRPAAWSTARAVAVAVAAALMAAMAWAVLRSVFDVTIGSLVVATLGGWGIGASLRRAGASSLLAVLLGAGAWVVGLLLAWLVAMVVLPGSTRPLVDRLAGTPFLDWLAPQLGVVEVAALVLFVGAALYAARPTRVPET
jgi:hypothetical protein